MIVNVEFLGEEPIENVITCIHFKVDKVIFFGYHDTIQKMRKYTEHFLEKYCSVHKIVFLELSRNSLQSVLKTMRAEIQYEQSLGSKVYFDITGGESLILVAFGILTKEFDTPIHMYDVPSDKLIELNANPKNSISNNVESQKVALDLNRYIEMEGGIINWGLHKSIKTDSNAEFMNDVSRIWLVAKKYINYWNPFSEFLRAELIPDKNLQVNQHVKTVINALSSSPTKLKSIRRLNSIVDDLAAEGILLDVEHENGRYRFRFKNNSIKECLWDGGSILELHSFHEQKKISDDCKVGVHLDWDGVIHTNRGTDVLNEVDVLSLKGNVPTFISCKSGKMGPEQALYALYELNEVANRFGGKYAKKVLISAKAPGDVYLERAAEMGIEVRHL